MSIFIDENDGFDHVRGARGLCGVGRFFAAQFGALSSAKKLNSTDPELINAPVLHSAQAKLEVFRRIVSGQMAQGKMMQDCRLAGVVLNAGKKKSTFGASGVALADEALEVVRDFAERDGADIFLISGTLLGPVRDGHLIRHDYDLDFGVFSSDPGMDRLEQSLRKDPRFDVRKTFRITPELSHYNHYMEGHTGKPLKYTILYKGAVTIDIFVHVRFENTIYHGTDRNIWLNSSFSLAPMAINNKTYLVPDNPGQYLKENYGNWREPVTDYHCATDTPNSGTVVSYRALLHGTKNYMRFKRAGDDRRARIIHGHIETMGSCLVDSWKSR